MYIIQLGTKEICFTSKISDAFSQCNVDNENEEIIFVCKLNKKWYHKLNSVKKILLQCCQTIIIHQHNIIIKTHVFDNTNTTFSTL